MIGGHVDHRFRSPAENESFNHDHDFEEEEEETLSLRDFPLTPSHSISAVDSHHHHNQHTSSANHSRRSTSPDFFFEFLINDDGLTSFADDVIFHGRLLPFFNPPPPRRSLSLSSAAVTRRSSTESTQPETRTIRPSRSLDCRKLRRNSTSKTELKSRNYSSIVDKKTTLPWYWLVFGLPVRIAAEMELKDIKNRQIRRNIPPVRLFSGEWERFSGQKSSSSASWRILSVLSCRSHASVQVKDDVVSKRFSPKYYVK